jgi:cell division protein FtsI/penicillin-binding protein 2
LAAIEDGVVTSDELIDCEGPVAYIDGLRVENVTNVLLNALRENHNILSFRDVIKYSCNVGVVKVVRRLGTKFYEHLRRVGFGTKTGIEFPGERAGFVNPPEHWSRSSLMVMSFGYEMTASLLQLGRAFAVIANDGYLVQPRLILADRQPVISQRLYKPETITTMKDILEQIGQKYGVKGCRVMGKTGTARCVRDGRYSKTAHNYTFVGIVEKDGYRRVIVTFIKEPSKAQLWASEVAAPLFHRVAEKMVIHDAMHDRVTL